MPTLPAVNINAEQRQIVEREILFELTGRSRTAQQQMRNETDSDTHILTSYWSGLCLAPWITELDVINFHKLVMRALLACRVGWPDVRKDQVRDQIASCEVLHGLEDNEAVSDHAIDFGLRMWLMLDCAQLGSEGTPSIWPEDMPLRQFADACDWFGSFQASSEDAQKTFPRKFTARQLDRIAGIKVKWTDLLSEHLVFDEKTEQLAVFKSKSWLVQMYNLQNINQRSRTSATNPNTGRMRSTSKESGNGSAGPVQHDTAEGAVEDESVSPEDPNPDHGGPHNGTGNAEVLGPGVCALPLDLLRETVRSLDLLFPITDKLTEDWLSNEKVDFHSVNRPSSMRREVQISRRQPRLREFKFLRERLLDLIEEYQSPPKHWKNIWRDRRNPMAFWTFWIGLAIFLITISVGIVASVLAGLTLGKDGISK